MLLQIVEQLLPQRLKTGLLAYCPTMDLVAAATEDNQVQVFRLNGQTVFVVSKREPEAVVTAMCWKPNGRVLIIAYNNGKLFLVSTYTGKVINQVSSNSFSESTVCSLGWGINFTDPNAARNLLESSTVRPGAGVAAKKAVLRGGLLDEALARGLQSLEIEVPLDLPADLRNLDIETSLPKLSVLPSSGPEDDAFSTRASIDTIFHTAKKDSNEAADVILVSFQDGTLHLSIYDFFELGTFRDLASQGTHVVQHCSHPYSSTHGLILIDEQARGSLGFVALDLKLIPDTGKYISLLASKSGQLQNIVRYMKSALTQISADYKTSQELPQRFMRNGEEDLQEKEQNTFVNAIYHFAATGNCSPVLKEWLVDQVGERGHKRWEKAAASGYDGICRYTLQNLIPALDRFMVLISRLRGLSRFFESSAALGLSTTELDLVLDTANCLKFMAHIILKTASTELRGFVAFSNWLKLEIEVQNTEPTSQSAEDFPAKYATLDYPSIFSYVQSAMQQSQLEDLCAESATEQPQSTEGIAAQDGLIYEDLKKTFKDEVKKDSRPALAAVLSRLDKQCQTIFSGIAAALRRKVRFGNHVKIQDDNVELFDSRMIVDNNTSKIEGCTAIVAFSSSSSPPVINLKRVHLTIVNGISSTKGIDIAYIRLPEDRVLKAIRFADKDTLIVAMSSSGTESPCICSLPVCERSEAEGVGLEYRAIASQEEPDAKIEWGLDLSQEALLQPYIMHVFDEKPLWVPIQVEAHGRKGRRALCVVAADRMRYRVFDLDNALDPDEDLDEGEEMDVEDVL